MIRKFCVMLALILVSGTVLAQGQMVVGTLGTQTLDFTEYFEQQDGTFDGIRVTEEWPLYGGEYHNFQVREKMYLGASFEIGEGTAEFCIPAVCVEEDLNTWTVTGSIGRYAGSVLPFISISASTIEIDQDEAAAAILDLNTIADRGNVEWDVDLGMWMGSPDRKFRITLDRLLSDNDVHRTVSLGTFFSVMNEYVGGIEFSYPISTESGEESVRLAFSFGMSF
ncbi:MAG: hypothetical protein OXO49_03235 [Gammaproteobacteria bacterium]|nr:hypothetical protein [Gammaproteobacteria bacterium]MDE0251993.1 hypothetical protein [Gammaproteobacteria bacterium]MDE0402899.1 hypothetical protein [Gammaproteobacteria bacterium]